MHDDPARLGALFEALCNAAAKETLARFRVGTDVTDKGTRGFDPVTEGDRAAEQAIRAILKHEVPDDGIVGEEFGSENEGARHIWIIDPIDGTRAFIAGLPTWGTLIGLYRDGVPFAGALDQPFTGERFLALPGGSGGTATLSVRGGKPVTLKSRETQSLDEAILMTTSPYLFSTEDRPGYKALESRVKLTRYGMDCYAYGMVAAGHIDLVAESGLSSYDIAAQIPIIEAAGGVVTTWDGSSAAQGGTVLASANPILHEKALAVLNG